jgi:hypothetical protein
MSDAVDPRAPVSALALRLQRADYGVITRAAVVLGVALWMPLVTALAFRLLRNDALLDVSLGIGLAHALLVWFACSWIARARSLAGTRMSWRLRIGSVVYVAGTCMAWLLGGADSEDVAAVARVILVTVAALVLQSAFLCALAISLRGLLASVGVSSLLPYAGIALVALTVASRIYAEPINAWLIARVGTFDSPVFTVLVVAQAGAALAVLGAASLRLAAALSARGE